MSSTTPEATAAWWPDTTNPFDAALAYHNAGLCVIPLSGKRPALGSWKHYQRQRPPEAAIRRWQQEGLLRNVGIVCGAVSSNLVVLDFDGPGAYGAFAALFPTLAQSFTVATGSGKGKHVYLYVDTLPPTTRALDTPIGNVELRAEGTYVAAPPSVHPVTGSRYIGRQARRHPARAGPVGARHVDRVVQGRRAAEAKLATAAHRPSGEWDHQPRPRRGHRGHAPPAPSQRARGVDQLRVRLPGAAQERRPESVVWLQHRIRLRILLSLRHDPGQGPVRATGHPAARPRRTVKPPPAPPPAVTVQPPARPHSRSPGPTGASTRCASWSCPHG